MNLRAILTLNDKNDPLIEDFKFNSPNLNVVKLQSQVFSLPPLYKHFIKRTEELVQIDANGNLGNPGKVSFSEVDAGVLFARFLLDLEKFLNKAATIPVDKAGTIGEEVTKILQAKKTLISSIATGLSILADAGEPGEPHALTMASEAFKQYLDTNITDAYLENVLLRFEVSQPGNNQSHKCVDFFLGADQPAFQKSTKGTFTLVDTTDTYQPAAAITQDIFLQHNTVSYQVEVPIPLNAPPAPSVFSKQEAVQASPDGTQKVKELTLWNYNLAFIIPQAAQDQVIIDVQFNSFQSDDLVNTSTNTKDLFSALAQYEYVANGLWKILETPANNSITPSPQYVNAIKTFAYLTENIVNYLSVRLPEPSPEIIPVGNTAGETKYQFITRSNYNESGRLNSITLSGISDNAELAVASPVLSIQSTSGSFIPLKAEKLTEHSVLYLIPEETSVTQVIQMSLLALDFEKVSVARAQLKVVRNQEMIPGITTNPVFTLISDAVTADPVSPTYIFDTPIDITKTGSNFTIELQAFFAQLFGAASDGKVISIEVSYLQPLSIDSEGNKGPMIQTPVVLLPPTSLSSATAVDVAKAAEAWFVTNQQPIQGAEWALSLKVYEKNDLDSQIILSIRQLVYQLAN